MANRVSNFFFNFSPGSFDVSIVSWLTIKYTAKIFGQPSEQVLPKSWSFGYLNRTKHNLYKLVVNFPETDTKTGNREPK